VRRFARARWIAVVVVVVVVAVVLVASSSSSPDSLFTGDFETADLSEWDHVQALPGRTGVVTSPVSQGDYAGRFEVEAGDEEPHTGSQRAEVLSGEEFKASDVRYFRVLARVESWDFDHWGIVWQIHDDSLESPPLSLQLEEGGDAPMLWLGHGNGSPTYWQAPLPGMDTWFEVVIGVEFGAEGSLQVWLDGKRQMLTSGKTTYDGVDTLGIAPGYDKLGIYRSPEATETAVVYHDDYRVNEEFFSDPP
jgi:hypothetical protein